MNRHAAAVVIASGLLTSACSDGPALHDDTAEAQAPIINGSVDNSGNYEAVVAVFSSMGKCTGTIIAKDPPWAFVLTAAHCVDDFAPQYVVQGVNHDDPSAILYHVEDYDWHNSYNGSAYDFAMIRITGAAAATPTISVLRQFEDNIGTGTPVTHLGYGVIDTGPNPDTGTSYRHITTGTVSSHSGLTLTFGAASSGVCFGDSGGPNIHQATGKVAGVNSYVQGQTCATSSVSGRASAFWDSYINPYINSAPPPPSTCTGCSRATTTGLGECKTAMNTCLADTTCNSLSTCLDGCNDTACADQCVTWYSAAADLYQGVRACLCDTACTTECGGHAVCTADLSPETTTSSAAATSSSSTGGAGGTSGVGGATTGAGAANNNGDGFVPGDTENSSPSGTILTSGCATGGGDEDGSLLWLALGALGVAVRRRR